ncbi:hypothetical protein OpiT1DRAFT_05639 [Opitutaceae bacterium TAV1]|nr:hypothetical protein OpiT1DRAFT_05639 [Opitutaceae bacterium TAV1]
MNPRIHLEACRIVRERKAPDYRAACAMIAKRRRYQPQPVQPRLVRMPYRDD